MLDMQLRMGGRAGGPLIFFKPIAFDHAYPLLIETLCCRLLHAFVPASILGQASQHGGQLEAAPSHDPHDPACA